MLGEVLVQLRKKQNLSQQEVADRLSVSRQTISNWECGAAAPALDKAAELAELYQVSLDELAEAYLGRSLCRRPLDAVGLSAIKSGRLLGDLVGRTCRITYVDGKINIGEKDTRAEHVKVLAVQEGKLRCEVLDEGAAWDEREQVIDAEAVQCFKIE